MRGRARALSGSGLAWSLVSVLAACGGDDSGARTTVQADGGDASSTVVSSLDAGVDASLDAGVDASLDATVAPPPPRDGGGITEKILFSSVTPGGHDRFFGLTHDAVGNFYAVGQTSSSTAVGADFSFVLAKFDASGVLQTSFGSGGFAIKNVTVGGSAVEAARGVVIQADGKIVVAGDAEHQAVPNQADAGPGAADADVCLVRFTANGQLDESFGTAGVVCHNLADGVVTQPLASDNDPMPRAILNGTDAFWSISQAADGKLLLHAATRGLGPNAIDGGVRTDSDFALVRLSADGVLDATFGAGGATPGVVRTDFNHTEASVRAATLLSDGTVVGAGYANSSLLTGNASVVNPVIYKLRADGTPDPTFATADQVPAAGIWYDFARTDMKSAEAYGAVLQGDKLVTFGYGPTPNRFGNGTADLLWLRYNSDGSQDTSFGTRGNSFQDVGGYDDNGRALAELPDKRMIGVGRATPKPATVPHNLLDAPADGLISIIAPDGAPDEAFYPGGVRLYDFGGAQDHLWAVAVSPDKKRVVAVGTQAAGSASGDDNGAVVILSLP